MEDDTNATASNDNTSTVTIEVSNTINIHSNRFETIASGK